MTDAPFSIGEDWASIALIVLLYAEHLCLGGNRVDWSLGFSLAQALLLAVVISLRWGRSGFERLVDWPITASLFALTLFCVALSLIPLPFAGHSIWRAVGEPIRVAIFPFGVLIELVKLLGYASAFTTAAILSADRRRGAVLLNGLIFAGLLFALLCLILEGLSPTDVFGWRKPIISAYRVSGLFSSANTAATVFGLSALLAAGGLLRETVLSARGSPISMLLDWIKYSPIKVASFLLNLGCLLLSASRGGIAAFAVGFALLIAWQAFGHGRKGRSAWLILAGLAVGLVVLSGGMMGQRFAHAAFLQDERPRWAMQAWMLVTQSPIMGYGLGSLPEMFKAQVTSSNVNSLIWAGSAHNVYLQWLVQVGLLGALPMFALIVWVVRGVWAELPESSSAKVWRQTLIACTVLVLAHSLFEYSLEEPSIAVFWSILLGAGQGVASLRRRVKKVPGSANFEAGALA